MSESFASHDATLESLAAEVADDFLERINRDEDPQVEDYVRRYPQIAEMLRQLLPAVRLMRLSDSREEGGSSSREPQTIDGILGDFRIKREIGRGGMGVVYEAQQISLSRRVALKVLPFAAALDPKRLERFRNEAQASAQLHHSHIVPVYSVGCERGVYYYAMQFIEGESLAEIIHQLRQLPGSPVVRPGRDSSGLSATISDVPSSGPRFQAPPGLASARSASSRADREAVAGPEGRDGSGRPGTPTPPGSPSGDPPETGTQSARERPRRAEPGNGARSAAAETRVHASLSTAQSTRTPGFIRTVAELGLQAADALEHAHNLDIVHRDIKPANLLMDFRGSLWITDFGLARFRSDAGLTMTGDLIGTLRYMSPEQALARHGAVDHRTDIYSLGVTLYELLTLEPALDGQSREELLRQIAQEEPALPRRKNRAVPQDLETILLKAMAKEPENRYATAAELADDLRRFLDHRPILAKRPSLWERTVKWSRRHKPLVVSAVVVLMMAVVGLTVSTVVVAQEQAETEQAYSKLAKKNRELQAAYKSEAEQRELAERNFQQAQDMLALFTEVCTEDMAGRPAMQDIRSKLLHAALDYYQAFIEQAEDNLPLQADLAGSHYRVARILHEIGSTPAALDAMEQACGIQEKLVRRHPENTEYRKRLLRMYHHLGVFRGKWQLHIADEESVQNDLQLSEAQEEQINALDANLRELFDFRQLLECRDVGQLRRLYQQKMEAARNELHELLSPDQAERLHQIFLQLRERDPRSWTPLNDQDVAEALQLTMEQRLEIQALEEEGHQAFIRLFKQKDQGDDEASRRRIYRQARQQRETYRQRIHAVLTPEQRQRWQEMLGEPFEGDICRHPWKRNNKHRHRHGKKQNPEPQDGK